MGKRIKADDLLRGIWVSAERMGEPFTDEQGEVLIDVLSYKKPHMYLPKIRNSKLFSEEQATMIGTALQQNYAPIATLMEDFPVKGFRQEILDGIKETVNKKGQITEEELKRKYSNHSPE